MKNMYRLARTATRFLGCLPITATLFSVPNALANTLVLTAIDDFPDRIAGPSGENDVTLIGRLRQ